jgi:hypothetical protein
MAPGHGPGRGKKSGDGVSSFKAYLQELNLDSRIATEAQRIHLLARQPNADEVGDFHAEVGQRILPRPLSASRVELVVVRGRLGALKVASLLSTSLRTP